MVDGGVLVYSYLYMGFLQASMCWTLFFLDPGTLGLMERKTAAVDYTVQERFVQMQGSTVYYWTLVCGQVGAGLATTTSKESLFTYGVPNHRLNITIVLELVLALSVIYKEPLQRVFKTVALSQPLLAMGALPIIAIVVIEEIRKAHARSKV
eukprot:TRINITY_DN4159_c1_g1_i2.p1 TRINITY_DN4159_c1_g1~~TRINITY_DN4159_c1_g1_i2.p1  ORF type:complete len:152 (+),score=21.10 TRINITY_DN4159_c1_g1_i2:126-581(+)